MITLDGIGGRSSPSKLDSSTNVDHDRIGDFDAAMLAEYQMYLPKGVQKVQQMICDDMRVAMRRDDLARANDLFRTLQHFIKDHPEATRETA